MQTGTGIYTPADAAALLHEKPETVRRWAFGYARVRPAGRHEYPPLIRTALPVVEGERALTFVELIELLYVRAFHRTGLTWGQIKAAAGAAARIYSSEHPFALRQLYVDPGGLYAALREVDGTESLVQLTGHGQHVFPDLVKPFLEQLEFDADDVATRWWPLGRGEPVVVDPRQAFGAPVVEGTAIRTGVLADAVRAESAAHGEKALERVAWTYEIRPRQVETALRFQAWLKKAA